MPLIIIDTTNTHSYLTNQTLAFTMFMKNPQILFFFGIVLLHYSCFPHFHLAMSSAAAATSNFTDQSALLAFKSKLTFDPTNTVLGGNWTTTTSFCNWIGVSCSKRRQRVTALELPFMGLQGTISPHVGNLSFLVSLDLRNNSFFGFIPHEISRLHRLRILILQYNQLEGNIPPTLHHCQKLQVISLAVNSLSGVIPNELGFLPSLEKLYLGGNNYIAGEFPSFMGNISTLQELNLGKCGLTGILPADLCRFWPNIQLLNVHSNKLVGQIPSTIDRCKEIRLLSLMDNRLVGSIPKEIGSLQNLEELYLAGNSLTGSIPPTIGNLSNLKVFDMVGNKITGSIPRDLGNLSNLFSLLLGKNSLTGTIPHTIGNLSNLKQLSIQQNYIMGSIPRDLGHLSNLFNLALTNNSLTGEIPQEIFNISSLQTLSLDFNSLSGTFPSFSTTRVFLPNIEYIYLSLNQITGHIPSYISNFTKLTELELNTNLLYGPIPMNLGSIKGLQYLNLERNQLTGEPGILELRFLSSLFNCTSLQKLYLDEIPLNGSIPDTFGSLLEFSAKSSQIKGHIPKTIGSWKNLTYLGLENNHLSGQIPPSVGGLERLQRLYLQNNNIEGFIPDELCLLRNLGDLSLANNNISGLIPNCIGNLTGLQIVRLNSNRLTSMVPMNLLNLENLLVLNLSCNSFSGDLTSGMRKSNVFEMMDLSWNQISGNIPSIIGAFQSLNSLNLSNNLFIGPVPQSFGDLKGLEFLDLSYNDLSGTIPKSLESLKYLKNLNFSFNQLSGEIPSGGPFVNFTSQSFLENRALCGRTNFGVPPCTTRSTQKSRTIHHLLKYILPPIASTMILIALIYMYLTKYQKGNAGIPSLFEWVAKIEHRMISYHELRRATNDFCESNSLGVGSFGSVYKGILSDGTIVAVKVLNLQRDGAFESFDAECKVWRAIRHRNLIKVITVCSSLEVRALVLQYMSNGSLEKWLYSHNYCLNLLQRVSIMVDIASAVEYLHHGQSEMVVHCDLKPSNILLNEDMVAHVGDFGLSKVLAKDKDATQTRTIGTLGYVAPEYGSTGKVSTKGDVYSYGIMLLEIIARKKPTDEMFSGEQTLRQWIINVSLPNSVLEVVDVGLLSTEQDRDVNATKDIIFSIMEIGLRCSEEVPEERMDITDVVSKLIKIKLALENRNRGV